MKREHGLVLRGMACAEWVVRARGPAKKKIHVRWINNQLHIAPGYLTRKADAQRFDLTTQNLSAADD
jgi:hypothetical protein